MEWEKDEEGLIKTCPLLLWETAVMPLGGLVRLEYAESLSDIDRGKRQALQIHMSAIAAAELGQALLEMANTIAAESEGSG